MAPKSASSRRTFLKGGAMFAAPLVASVSAAALARSEADDRVAHLEAEAAIRELHHAWLRQVNSGARSALLDSRVSGISADYAAAPDRIEIAPDGRAAVGYFNHTVELQTPLATDSTLAQMARVQGTATRSYTERQTLKIEYVRIGERWTMTTLAFS